MLVSLISSKHCKMNSALKGSVCMFIRIELFLEKAMCILIPTSAPIRSPFPVRRFIWIWSGDLDIMWSTTQQEESKNECEKFL